MPQRQQYKPLAMRYEDRLRNRLATVRGDCKARADAAAIGAEADAELEAVHELLFDGWKVLAGLDPRAAERMGEAAHRNVSDVLDAVVRVLRSNVGAKPGATVLRCDSA